MPCTLFPSFSPALPPFDTLLVKGSYHPSAPIHLCISHLQSNPDTAAKVLFLSSSQHSLTSSLEVFNESWLAEHALTGTFAPLLSRIDISYPPSTVHWLSFLSLLRPASTSLRVPHRLAVLPHTVSLIVLHEPSAYFFSSSGFEIPILSHYLQLITSALSVASFLSPRKAVPVVLFDGRLGDLRLPIVRPPTPSRRQSDTLGNDEHVRQEQVARFVERYFAWIGVVSEMQDDESLNTLPFDATFGSLTIRGPGPYKLILKNQVETDNPQEALVWTWSEIKRSRRGRTETRLHLLPS